MSNKTVTEAEYEKKQLAKIAFFYSAYFRMVRKK